MLPKDSLYMVGRREGSLMAVDCFCHRFKLNWISPSWRYKLFCWFFGWYSHSKIGWLIESNFTSDNRDYQKTEGNDMKGRIKKSTFRIITIINIIISIVIGFLLAHFNVFNVFK